MFQGLCEEIVGSDLYMIDMSNEIYSDMKKLSKFWKEHAKCNK